MKRRRTKTLGKGQDVSTALDIFAMKAENRLRKIDSEAPSKRRLSTVARAMLLCVRSFRRQPRVNTLDGHVLEGFMKCGISHSNKTRALDKILQLILWGSILDPFGLAACRILGGFQRHVFSSF